MIDKKLIGKIVKIEVLDHFTATKKILEEYGKKDWVALVTYGLIHAVYDKYIVIYSRTISDNEDKDYSGDLHYIMKCAVRKITILKKDKEVELNDEK